MRFGVRGFCLDLVVPAAIWMIDQVTQPNQGWNGAIDGMPVDEATFAWICNFQFDGKPLRVEKGTIIRVR